MKRLLYFDEFVEEAFQNVVGQLTWNDHQSSNSYHTMNKTGVKLSDQEKKKEALQRMIDIVRNRKKQKKSKVNEMLPIGPSDSSGIVVKEPVKKNPEIDLSKDEKSKRDEQKMMKLLTKKKLKKVY